MRWRWIRASGGIAVLAHPGRYDLKPMMRDEMLKQFKALGGEAIEVVTGSHRPEQYAVMAAAWRWNMGSSRRAAPITTGRAKARASRGGLPPLHASLTPVWTGGRIAAR